MTDVVVLMSTVLPPFGAPASVSRGINGDPRRCPAEWIGVTSRMRVSAEMILWRISVKTCCSGCNDDHQAADGPPSFLRHQRIVVDRLAISRRRTAARCFFIRTEQVKIPVETSTTKGREMGRMSSCLAQTNLWNSSLGFVFDEERTSRLIFLQTASAND